MGNPPGLSLEAARWLTARGISIIGADQECVEVGPSQHEDNWFPGHFLAEAGVPIIELLKCQRVLLDRSTDLSAGSAGVPIRPLGVKLN